MVLWKIAADLAIRLPSDDMISPSPFADSGIPVIKQRHGCACPRLNRWV